MKKMNIRQFNFEYISLDITRERIEKFMGYDPGAAPEPFPEMIDFVLEKIPSYCDIRGGFRLFDSLTLDRKKHELILGEHTFNIKKIITYQLRKADKAALFICTAGKDISNWSKKLMKQGDLMEGYVVDIVGSEIVETAMDRIQESLETEMKSSHLGITERYSPGYCGWQVSEQPKLFSFFPNAFCGVTLSPSCLMDPIKSVSGVIGIGAKAERNGYICNFCDMKDCIYRNKRIETSQSR